MTMISKKRKYDYLLKYFIQDKANGMTLTQIAEKYQVSRSTVSTYLKNQSTVTTTSMDWNAYLLTHTEGHPLYRALIIQFENATLRQQFMEEVATKGMATGSLRLVGEQTILLKQRDVLIKFIQHYPAFKKWVMSHRPFSKSMIREIKLTK